MFPLNVPGPTVWDGCPLSWHPVSLGTSDQSGSSLAATFSILVWLHPKPLLWLRPKPLLWPLFILEEETSSLLPSHPQAEAIVTIRAPDSAAGAAAVSALQTVPGAPAQPQPVRTFCF